MKPLPLVLMLAACSGGSVPADRDGDGIPDRYEEEFGTDPGEADSDGDGIPDGREIAPGGSDPLDRLSWPDGVWPDFSANASVSDAGFAIGQQMPDIQLIDADGQTVNLHQFYGMVVLLDLGAGWCGPCRTVAQTAEEEYQARRDDGFVTIHLMIDGNAGEPDQAFLEGWRNQYRLTFPVTRDPGNPTLEELDLAGVYDGGIPFQVVLDRDMTITFAGSGVNPLPEVDSLLGSP